MLLCFASYRAWRFVALDDLPPLVAVRDRAVRAIADRHGNEWADGIECPWCSGWWVSCAVVGIVWALRPLPLPGLWFLATSAAVACLAGLAED